MSRLLLVLSVLGAAASARAETYDYVEQIFGATTLNAVAGHGRLTAGISAEGDLAMLAWPGPGSPDQLNYLSSNRPNARGLPHTGVLDGMGGQIGLIVDGRLTWLRDAPWTHEQGYTTSDAPVPVTRFANATLGLDVTVTDVVSPDVDVLTRGVRVARRAGSTVREVALVTYENLSPTLSEVDEVPFADWAFDEANDFIAAWDEDSGAILHFRPGDRGVYTSLIELAFAPAADLDYGSVEPLMKQVRPADGDVQAMVNALDGAFPSGVAALVTTSPPPASHQVGGDATPFCAAMDEVLDNLVALPETQPDVALPITPQQADLVRCQDPLSRIQTGHGWMWRPADARADLADGKLDGSSLAAAQTNGALITPLTFDGDGAQGEVLIALGATRAQAKAALATARGTSFAARQAAAEAAAHAALAGMPLPDAALGERVVKVAQRALVNLYVARDAASGAFLASVAHQPPYELDWPRDGAFDSVAFDLGTGAPLAWNTQRCRWYTGLARGGSTPGSPLLSPEPPLDPDTGRKEYPADAWEMNYYPSGVAGGTIRFEIDNTALHVWATAVHAATLSGSERKQFVDAVWPADKKALELLIRWRDEATGLAAPANEDDNVLNTSTLFGASAVLTGLRAGARLAHYVGDDDLMKRCLARADEQHAAMGRAFRDPATGRFREDGIPPGAGTASPTAWLVWPGRYYERGDPELEKQLAYDMGQILPELRGSGPGATYSAKNIIGAALYGSDTGSRAMAREAITLLADVATPDTLHFGEAFLHTDAGWQNVTSMPHVWEGMLFYLGAMALSKPAAFNIEERELPLPDDDGGCSCHLGGHARGPLPLAGLLLFALLLRRGRR